MPNEKEIFGLPQVLIEFKTKGTTAIKRSARGIVALILKQESEATMHQYRITSVDDIPEVFKDENLDYIKQVLLGTPLRVIVQTIAKDDVFPPAAEVAEEGDTPMPAPAPAPGTMQAALAKLGMQKWNYICMPEATAQEMSDLASWIKTKRNIARKTYKAVVSGVAADHEGVINYTTGGVKVGEKTYTAAQYTPRIAGILAGLALDRSATYYKLTEVEDIDALAEPGAAINRGELVLIEDGDYIKIGRACNSLVTFTTDKGEDFRKIKIVEGVDMITDDIRDTFFEFYVGAVINDYDHKMLFIAAIHVYFDEIKGNVLDRDADNYVEISYEKQRNYAILKGADVDSMDEMAIRKYNTGDNVFLAGAVKLVDAMENLSLQITM